MPALSVEDCIPAPSVGTRPNRNGTRSVPATSVRTRANSATALRECVLQAWEREQIATALGESATRMRTRANSATALGECLLQAWERDQTATAREACLRRACERDQIRLRHSENLRHACEREQIRLRHSESACDKHANESKSQRHSESAYYDRSRASRSGECILAAHRPPLNRALPCPSPASRSFTMISPAPRPPASTVCAPLCADRNAALSPKRSPSNPPRYLRSLPQHRRRPALQFTSRSPTIRLVGHRHASQPRVVHPEGPRLRPRLRGPA